MSAIADAGRRAWSAVRTRLGGAAPEQRAWLAGKQRDRRLRDHRSFVGPASLYDAVGERQLEVLLSLGLQAGHDLLDVGCGSLRAGRHLIAFLDAGRYCGLEPEAWLVEAGIEEELGRSVFEAKRPVFRHESDFGLGRFGRRFDFVVAHSIFSHASVAQIRCCMAEAAGVMRPGAAFLATFVPGTRDHEGDEWAHCAHYRPERLVELAAEQGLDPELPDWSHPNAQSWLVLRRGAQPGGAD